jgi:hypothetical protein
MSVTNQPIFRSSALRHYMQNQEKSSYLRFIPLPITILLWFLLGLLCIGTAVAWNETIPTYVGASGLIVAPGSGAANPPADRSKASASAILFLPPGQAATLHIGMSVRLFIGGATQGLESQIVTIAPGVRSPADIHARYEQANCSLLVTQPVTEVTVTLPKSVRALNGSLLAAQITVGSRRLLTLLPGVGHFFAA